MNARPRPRGSPSSSSATRARWLGQNWFIIFDSRRRPTDESPRARRESSTAAARYVAMSGIDTGSLGNGVLDVAGMV